MPPRSRLCAKERSTISARSLKASLATPDNSRVRLLVTARRAAPSPCPVLFLIVNGSCVDDSSPWLPPWGTGCGRATPAYRLQARLPAQPRPWVSRCRSPGPSAPASPGNPRPCPSARAHAAFTRLYKVAPRRRCTTSSPRAIAASLQSGAAPPKGRRVTRLSVSAKLPLAGSRTTRSARS